MRQRARYAGKKRRHTVKAERVVTPAGHIASVLALHPGSRHDLTIRREGPRLPRRARLYADSANQGYDREHPDLEVPW